MKRDLEADGWFADWFDSDYLALYRHRGESEAQLFLNCLANCSMSVPDGSRVLDLACGPGRHMRAIMDTYNWQVYGLDLSQVMLAKAQTVLAGNSPGAAPPLIRGDIRHLPFADHSFALVFSAFTSFGYFDSDDEHLNTLQEVARILQPEGGFVLDLINPEVVVPHLIPEDRVEREGITAIQRRFYDETTHKIHKNITLSHPDGSTREITEIVRVFTRNEIEELLQQAGFATERILGDYLGVDFDATDSERMILMNRKKR